MRVVPPTEIDPALFDPEGACPSNRRRTETERGVAGRAGPRMAYPKSLRGRGPAKFQRRRSRSNPGGYWDRLQWPNHPVCFALLSGEGAGRAVTDGTHALLHADFEFTFTSRGADAAFLDGAIRTLRPEQGMALVSRDAQPTSTLPLSQLVNRIEYRKHESIAAPALPDGYELRRIDAELIERCRWRGVVLKSCGTIARFLEVGIGWCAMRGDEIVSESYAVCRSATHYEIGVVTARKYRGLGLVVPTCTRLVEDCKDTGLDVYWSCHRSNLASQRAAEKLGFTDPRPYRYFCY